MKNPLIKICGITSEEEIRYIAKAGIDYAGFVLFFPKSKRNLSLECAKKLIAKLPAGVVSVAVTVSPTKEQVEAVVEAGFLAIQIHGKIEDSVITSCRIPVFKAFNVSDMDAFSHYEEMDEVAGFVMDEKHLTGICCKSFLRQRNKYYLPVGLIRTMWERLWLPARGKLMVWTPVPV